MRGPEPRWAKAHRWKINLAPSTREQLVRMRMSGSVCHSKTSIGYHSEHLSQAADPHSEDHKLVTLARTGDHRMVMTTNTLPTRPVPATHTEYPSEVTATNTESLTPVPVVHSGDLMSVMAASMEPIHRASPDNTRIQRVQTNIPRLSRLTTRSYSSRR